MRFCFGGLLAFVSIAYRVACELFVFSSGVVEGFYAHFVLEIDSSEIDLAEIDLS